MEFVSYFGHLLWLRKGRYKSGVAVNSWMYLKFSNIGTAKKKLKKLAVAFE